MTIQKNTLLLLSAICVSAVNVSEVLAAPVENNETQSSDLALALETLPTADAAREAAPVFAMEFQTEGLAVETEAIEEAIETEAIETEAVESETVATDESPVAELPVEAVGEVQTEGAIANNIPTEASTALASDLLNAEPLSAATETFKAPAFETLIPNTSAPNETAYDLSSGLESESIGEIEYETLAQFEEPAANGTPKFGQAGKQRWYVQGAVAADLDDDLFGLLGAGVTHFLYDYHSLSLELNGLAFSQPGDDAVGLNLALLLRSHWIRGENWSIYVDGGAGIIVTTNEVPAVGSSFNFTPQIGGGATFDIGNNNRLMTGLRWHHISNADLYESNPGLDAWFGYVGVNFPL